MDKHFFRPASRTVGFSLHFKNSGHVITFLGLSGLQNTDHVMSFSHVSPFFVEVQIEEGKMTSVVQFKIFYGDNFERCKMHRMKKERFELITYQEFTCETKWHHAISVLQTAVTKMLSRDQNF